MTPEQSKQRAIAASLLYDASLMVTHASQALERAGEGWLPGCLAGSAIQLMNVRDGLERAAIAQAMCDKGKHQFYDGGGPDFTCMNCGYVVTYEPDDLNADGSLDDDAFRANVIADADRCAGPEQPESVSRSALHFEQDLAAALRDCLVPL